MTKEGELDPRCCVVLPNHLQLGSDRLLHDLFSLVQLRLQPSADINHPPQHACFLGSVLEATSHCKQPASRDNRRPVGGCGGQCGCAGQPRRFGLLGCRLLHHALCELRALLLQLQGRRRVSSAALRLFVRLCRFRMLAQGLLELLSQTLRLIRCGFVVCRYLRKLGREMVGHG